MAQKKQGLNVHEVIRLVFEVVEQLYIHVIDEIPLFHEDGKMNRTFALLCIT